ncbi:MAG: hypothetical protein GY821_12270, partial [Gammaproteobacteria bacterium]|nr:hypothetical protein [Gammaproteobacteria bacterium]
CQEAFNKLKKKLIELHVLHYLDVIMGTDYIETDGSVRDLNVVLCQKNKRVQLRPINFACSGLSTSLPSNGPKRGAIATTENVHAHPQNQMTVRKTPNLGFNEVTDRDTELSPIALISSSTELSQEYECVAMTRDQNLSSVKNIEKPIVLNCTKITPVKIRCLKVNREVEGINQLALKGLSEGVTAKQTVQNLL